uniref:Uncharacterized protein LOC111135128 isoform X2 n=1 Tax=Crassostrea virginica TaxID=6565 RepID=A0A8B8ELF4_CRAVI|nr:uncharacterized protein LOC111135128 isoform X2 [Crassostrea virginica]
MILCVLETFSEKSLSKKLRFCTGAEWGEKWNLPNSMFSSKDSTAWRLLSHFLPRSSTVTKSTIRKISSTEITIVTAYWNLGTFRKGSNQLFTKNTYLTWTKSFKYLMNPLLIYTDCEEFRDTMQKLRSEGNLTYETEIFFIDRTKLWPFALVDQIQNVYRQPGYPAHYPNTVIPAYAAAQHAKYAVVADAVKKNIYNTSYYAWLDVGYFRDLIRSDEFFELKRPPDFDPSRLAVNLVSRQNMATKPYSIFRYNIVWVGGGLFIGAKDIVTKFERLYYKAVLYFLDQKLMNSDQQVLFSMYSKEGRKALRPDIELQLYIPKGHGNPWFYLGYLCRKTVQRNNETEFS